MTDQSLFPDRYPNEARPARNPATCCDRLSAPPGVPPAVWTHLHALAHSRLPFTVAGFMAVTDATDQQTRVAVRQGVQRDWLHPVWPERYQAHPIEQWVGSLPRRR